jgi:hypothetical protein
MSNVPFAVYTASGAELTNGQDERVARRLAQQWANERNEDVDVYQGSRHVDTYEPTPAAQLVDYNTTEIIRKASKAEIAASAEAAKHDGGAGVIEVDGRRCYVEGGAVSE